MEGGCIQRGAMIIVQLLYDIRHHALLVLSKAVLKGLDNKFHTTKLYSSSLVLYQALVHYLPRNYYLLE